LHCTISLPRGAADFSGRPTPNESNLLRFTPDNTKRLLLVEDEALVGMMMRDLLTELGFFVAGPFCSLAEANSVVAAQEFDGAVLDVNLGGELVYPLADALRARDVPFVFVTGYDEEGVEGRFGHIPLLQKPISRETLEQCLRHHVVERIDRIKPSAVDAQEGAR
jgi:CheY-like chemotaxis protein